MKTIKDIMREHRLAAVKPLPAKLDDEPTAQALRVVDTLWPDMERHMQTAWGIKGRIGLAASIDALCGLPALLDENTRLRQALAGAAAELSAVIAGLDGNRGAK